MAKSFNPKQTLLCHLCGEHYTEDIGHRLADCEDTLLKSVAHLTKQLAITKRLREGASLARQKADNKL